MVCVFSLRLQNPVADVINNFWGIMQPLLFGLIGTEIRLETIQLSLLLQGMAVLAFGLFVSIPIIMKYILLSSPRLRKRTVRGRLHPRRPEMLTFTRVKLHCIINVAGPVGTYTSAILLFVSGPQGRAL